MEPQLILLSTITKRADDKTEREKGNGGREEMEEIHLWQRPVRPASAPEMGQDDQDWSYDVLVRVVSCRVVSCREVDVDGRQDRR